MRMLCPSICGGLGAVGVWALSPGSAEVSMLSAGVLLGRAGCVPCGQVLMQRMELAAVLCLASKSALALALQTVAPCGCEHWTISQMCSPLWLC